MSVISAIGCGTIGVVLVIAGVIGVYVHRNDPPGKWEISDAGRFMCGWDDDDDGFGGCVC